MKSRAKPLTSLIGGKNKRKSFSFEEDEGFVFKRAKTEDKSEIKVPRKNVKVNKTKQNSLLKLIEKPIEPPVKQAKQPVEQPAKKQAKLLPKQNGEKKKRGRPKKSNFQIVKEEVTTPVRTVIRNDDDDDDEAEMSIQMTLPLLDSPIQRRNKDLRNSSSRRSSLSNRGKRVSSIGNGFKAVPHADVPVEDFYKHLDNDVPDPHKMRSLLIWCGKKLLSQDKLKTGKRNNDEITLFNILKVIKEEIVRDLVEGRINTSWYNREESVEAPVSKAKVKILPNVQNLTNQSNIKLLKARLEQLQNEKLEWIKLYQQIPTSIPAITTLKPALKDDQIIHLQTEVDKLQNSSTLEAQVDQFHKMVNNLQSCDTIISSLNKDMKTRINSLFNEISLLKPTQTLDLLKGISRLPDQ